MLGSEPQKIGKFADELANFVANTRFALNIDKRQILSDLRGIHVDFVGNLR
jgi:hypothetical protein